MIRNPRVAGYRMVTSPRDPSDPNSARYAHIKRDHRGKPVIGQWQRMCSPEEWRAVIAIIGQEPKSRKGYIKPTLEDGGNSRVYLCVGTLRCGKCDHFLRAKKAYTAELFYYSCPSKAEGGCGGVRVAGPETDEVVSEIVIALWEKEAARRGRKKAEAPKPWEKAGELTRVSEDLTALRAARRNRTISAELYYVELGQLETEERKLVQEQTAFLRKQAKAAPVNLRRDWHSLTIADQRAYIQRALTTIVIEPVGRGRQTAVKDRLTPIPARA